MLALRRYRANESLCGNVLPIVSQSRPQPSELYSTLWRFAAERHLIYLRRLRRNPAPWTADPILSAYRFTNTFRAADRVSQYLIRLAYRGPESSSNTLFLRTILFKVFNRIDTWEYIVEKMGLPVASRFEYSLCNDLLDVRRTKVPIYSAAYIMPPGRRSGISKCCMHLHLIRKMISNGLPTQLERTRGLHEAYDLLLSWPTLGPFLAYQYAIDLNYTSLMSHPEGDFVVAGPGALDGLAKCFTSLGQF